jgi:hypothetical protein
MGRRREECRLLQSAPYDRAEEESMDLHSGYYERGQERRGSRLGSQLAHICCEAISGHIPVKSMTYESIIHSFRLLSIRMGLKPFHDDNSGPNKDI